MPKQDPEWETSPRGNDRATTQSYGSIPTQGEKPAECQARSCGIRGEEHSWHDTKRLTLWEDAADLYAELLRK